MEKKQKLKIEIIAALASVLTGVILGEKDFERNLISGIVSAIVMVLAIEFWYKIKKENLEKSKNN